MNKLSVIIPFVGEYPQVIFTVQNIAQDLMGRADFEIIVVDNYCEDFRKQAAAQNRSPEPDKGGEVLRVCSGRINPWLKYTTWDKNLSHWQAKRVGVNMAEGDVYWFCDSHCIVSRDGIYGMYKWYVDNYTRINGSAHMPLTYKILESRRLIYKLVTNMATGTVDYSFTPLRITDYEFEVPCMSCCGIMISKELYEEVGGWPLELGIYGGGEQFMNFTLAVLGKSKWIYPASTLFHHGEARSYHYVYDNYIRNKMIACYLYGGEAWLTLFSQNTKGRPATLISMKDDIIKRCKAHREHIKARQVMTIQDWVQKWAK